MTSTPAEPRHPGEPGGPSELDQLRAHITLSLASERRKAENNRNRARALLESPGGPMIMGDVAQSVRWAQQADDAARVLANLLDGPL